MVPRTLNEVFLGIVERNVARLMLYRQHGAWAPVSTSEFAGNVFLMARALRGWGLTHGDRVALLSENRREWTVVDFACLLIGAVVVPLYPTLTPEQTAFMLRDSGARAIFVSNQTQLDKVLSIRAQTSLEQIVIMEASDRTESMSTVMTSSSQGRDVEMEALARTIVEDDLATIIYTSGTTGVPKGVMLTHGQMAANLACSLGGFDLAPGDVSISYLPLSHITARHLDYAVLNRGVTLAYVSAIDQLLPALAEVRPTIFVGVPRLFEKIHAQVELKAQAFPKRQIYKWAIAVGRNHSAEVLDGRLPNSVAWKLASQLLYSKVRGGMGGRVRIFISGGAPLGRDLARWFADVGIRIHEGYGLTETSPVIALNYPEDHKLGTVGKPLSNVQVRIADDGEILVRGPSIFKSYWNRPEETDAAFVEGWFKTGDIGNLDADGFLSVTDRKKDLIKTSGGKFIAPQPLESSLKHNPLIAEAVVFGDKRKFAGVLIAPNFAVLEEWARGEQLTFSSRQELVAAEMVHALYLQIVEDLNQNLAQFERMKKVIVVAETFSAEDGSLTASMKLRRRVVEDRYRDRIEAIYTIAEAAIP
jgi:long-chain acyl-CoA synthetase